jgi:hypothetical protein
MTVYTIFTESGRELGKFATLEEAAIEMLTQEGHRFEIRQLKDRYRLFVSHRAAAHGRLIEWEPYAAATKEGVYRRVVANRGVKGTYAGEGL